MTGRNDWAQPTNSLLPRLSRRSCANLCRLESAAIHAQQVEARNESCGNRTVDVTVHRSVGGYGDQSNQKKRKLALSR